MTTVNKLEAAADGKIFCTHNGVDYTVDDAENWELPVLRAYEEGKNVKAVELLLGAKQFAAFEKSYGGNPKVKDLNALAADVFGAMGTSEGE